MAKLSEQLRASPFASLLGFKAAKSESDEDKKDDDKKDDESAESEEDDTKDDDKKKDVKKAKKAKADEDDKKDDESAESDDDDAKASATAAERARCARIVAHGIKTGAVRQAATYAFDTDMSASVAIATLDVTAEDRKASSRGLAERMESEKAPIAKPEASEAPAAGTVEARVAAASAAIAKAQGKTA